MCGCPVGGHGWPGFAQWTPRGPTTLVSTLKQLHPWSLSCAGLRPPELLAAEIGKASAAATSSGIINRRISPHLLRLRLPISSARAESRASPAAASAARTCALGRSLLL